MSQTKVSYKRHLAKTISYRIISTTIGFIVMWWASGNIKIGAAFGVVELLYKPIQYYIHERIWYRFVKFGISDEKQKRNKKNSEVEPTKTSDIQKKGKRLNYSSSR